MRTPDAGPSPFTRRQRLALLAGLVLLDLLLFVPGFVYSAHPQDLLPFFPKEHPHGAFGFDARSAVEYVKALLLRRPNLDIFRVSAEYVLLLTALVVAARGRARRWVLWVSVALYVGGLTFVGYHHALHYYFSRPPMLGEDWRLLGNLVDLVGKMPGWLLSLAAGLAALVGLGGAAFAVFRALQRLASSEPRLWRPAVLAVAACAASLAWFGPDRDDPEVQALSKHLVANLRASLEARERRLALGAGEPDRRYDEFARVSLRRKPDVSLLMIEAYGEVLATWDMTPAYRVLMSRVEARLRARGFSAATFYSSAPVHGGWSWLSIATVHTGMLIDQAATFTALETAAPRIPTLTSFFRQQGYHTYTLQPGTSAQPNHPRDLYGHDVMMGAEELAYRGHQYGFGRIPDQYSLTRFREEQLARASSPRYLFYMAVSTHFPWGDGVPPYVKDPHVLNDGPGEPSDTDASWPPIAEKAAIGSDYRRGYFQSVEYEWRVLTELLESDPSQDLVVIVMGDHQPRLESNPPGEVSMNTPVHVLSRDPAFVDGVVHLGAQRGLFADPALHPPMQHEGLYSMLVSMLAAQYGDEQSATHAVWSPGGAETSGLNR